MKQFVVKHFQTLIIVGLVILVILLVTKSCGKNSDDRVKALQAKVSELEKEKKDADNVIIFQRQKYSTDSAEWRGREQLAVIEKREAEAALQKQQSKIQQLTAIIRNSNHSGDTTDMVLTTKKYKNACDSLPAEIDKLNLALAEKDSSIDQWSEILAYEIQLRDSALEAEQKHSAKLNELYTRQSKITEQALKAARPRGRLLGGVGLIGDQVNPLSGTKITLAYQSKGGKQYQVGGILFKGGVYYEATVLITLIK